MKQRINLPETQSDANKTLSSAKRLFFVFKMPQDQMLGLKDYTTGLGAAWTVLELTEKIPKPWPWPQKSLVIEARIFYNTRIPGRTHY